MTGTDPEDPLILHATTVAVDGQALVILGPAGSGKSSLALQLIALGAGLVADDRTILHQDGGRLVASCPEPLRGLIEARGLGLLRADPAGPTTVALVVDLERRETERLPPPRHFPVLGRTIDLVLGQEGSHFPAALMLRLRGGRADQRGEE